MKIRYADMLSERRCSLQRKQDRRRIEISIHDNLDASTFTLVALSGPDTGHADKEKCLGPFHSVDQAKGAASALITALQNDGFEIIDQPFQWEMIAARLARDLRNERKENAVDTTFVPLGVPPESD